MRFTLGILVGVLLVLGFLIWAGAPDGDRPAPDGADGAGRAADRAPDAAPAADAPPPTPGAADAPGAASPDAAPDAAPDLAAGPADGDRLAVPELGLSLALPAGWAVFRKEDLKRAPELLPGGGPGDLDDIVLIVAASDDIAAAPAAVILAEAKAPPGGATVMLGLMEGLIANAAPGVRVVQSTRPIEIGGLAGAFLHLQGAVPQFSRGAAQDVTFHLLEMPETGALVVTSAGQDSADAALVQQVVRSLRPL